MIDKILVKKKKKRSTCNIYYAKFTPLQNFINEINDKHTKSIRNSYSLYLAVFSNNWWKFKHEKQHTLNKEEI